ncbi:MAG: MFS transporter [Caldilineaceae bacterium]
MHNLASALTQREILTPLGVRDFRFLITSNFLWWQARWMESILVGWLVLELTNSAWQVALMAFYRSIPFLLVGFFSGSLIDRFGRRACIQFAQTCNFLISVLITLLLWLGRLELWHLAVAAFVMGSVWSVDWPARRSLIPDLVGKEQTVNAMMMENFVQNLSAVFGPFLGGAFIAALGPAGCYTALTITAGLALIMVLGLSKQPIPRTAMPAGAPAGESPFRRIGDGLQYAWRNHALLGVMFITMVMNLCAFPYMDMLPVIARDVLHQGPIGLGMLGAATGVGSFIGLFVITKLRQRISHSWIFAGGSAFMCLMLIGFALSTNLGLSLLLLVIGGLGRVCFGVMQSSIMLLSSSDEMRSRVMGSLTLFIGAGPFGRLQIGALATAFGAASALALQAGLGIVAIGVVLLILPGFRRAGVVQAGPVRTG